jgi:hypothetical protein
MARSGPESGVVLNGSSGYSPQTDSWIADLGVPWVRVFASWASIEPTRGTLSVPQVVGLEAGLRALPRGTKVLVDVLGTPQWESGSSDPMTPPRNPADYGAFMGRLAKRMGSHVAAYELWNEEDSQGFWSTGPNARQYTGLLRAAYPTIKHSNRHATVVLGGLTGNDWEFLQKLYRDGAKGYFDAVSVHTDTACDIDSPYDYEWSAWHSPMLSRWSFLGYRAVHAVELANHDDKPIWMTELGWSTYPEVCNTGVYAGHKAGGVSYEDQATYLRQAYHCMAQTPYVAVAIWFGLQDSTQAEETRSDFGLIDTALGVKPAFAALASYAKDGDTLQEPCGRRPR